VDSGQHDAAVRRPLFVRWRLFAFWVVLPCYFRLIEVKIGGNTQVRYYYDGLNRLAKKDLTTGNDTIYLYDGWRCIEERELDGEAWEARRQYVYGGIYIDHAAARLRQASEPLIFDKDSVGGDGVCDNARYFYCQQANYNVVAMADSTGASAETVTYDPYGQATISGNTGNPFLFQGERYDSDAGLYYFRNRWYHPVLGRFMQRDPMGYVDGWTLCEFLKANPIANLDPQGTLTVIRKADKLNVRCGGRAQVIWEFTLDDEAPCDGYIVQKVDFTCSVKRCRGGRAESEEFSYWEAWFVRERTRGNVRDISSLEADNNRCGEKSSKGTVKFFCRTTTGDLSALGVGRVFGSGRCTMTAISLPSTDKKPAWWDKQPVEGPANRLATVDWKCCPRQEEYVNASAEP